MPKIESATGNGVTMQRVFFNGNLIIDNTTQAGYQGERLAFTTDTAADVCALYDAQNSTVYYTDTEDFATATAIYTNPEKTIIASDGYYSNATIKREYLLFRDEYSLLAAENC